ncbi:hypothetical protein AAKU55_003660 [Oxalobacteraceae bacterium GrIS 1.11]
MKPMRPLLAACLYLAAHASFADNIPEYDYTKPLKDGVNVVGMECHKKNGTLELGYFDSTSPPTKRMDLWRSYDLVKYDAHSMVKKILEVERHCQLADDRYVIRFRGAPGNSNAMGHCGATVYAGAKVWKNGVMVFDQDFESCDAKETIRSVRFSHGSDLPQIHKVAN